MLEYFFFKYAVYPSNSLYICEIFIPMCFQKRKYCNILLSFSELKCGIQLVIQCI